MPTPLSQGERRNREIGAILAQARHRQQRTITDCATLLETSRRRYRAIEQGEVGVEVAELELLLRYLEIPPHLIWPASSASGVPCRVIRLQPGQIVQVIGEEA